MEKPDVDVFWFRPCEYCDVSDGLRVGWQPQCEESIFDSGRLISIPEGDLEFGPQFGYRGDIRKWASLPSRAKHPSSRMAAKRSRLVPVVAVE